MTSILKCRWCLRRLSFWTTWRHQMWYFEVFETFKSCINLFKNLLSIYFVKFAKSKALARLSDIWYDVNCFILLWKNRLKVSQKTLIWNFHLYVAFGKGLGHDLMNQTHAMHFSIISKNVVWMPNPNLWKTYFWKASHCHNPKI